MSDALVRRILQVAVGGEEISDVSHFHAKIFLGVNIVIVILLLLLILGYCCVVRNRVEIYVRSRDNTTVLAVERTARNNPPAPELEENSESCEEESREKRQARLMESFLRNKVTMVVKREDFCSETSEHFSLKKSTDLIASSEDNLTTDSNTSIQPGSCDIPNDSSLQESADIEAADMERINDLDEIESRRLRIDSSRVVPNCCAICLGPYDVGETVVWNSRVLCNHVFHLNCMIDWLTKMREGTPCPCCRQEFTDLPVLPKKEPVRRREYIIARTFDPRAIVFR